MSRTHIPRTYGEGLTGVRQVLRPGKRKAARHPWASILHAARTGGVVIRYGERSTNVTCHGCGARFGIAGQSTGSDDDCLAEETFEEDVRYHESGECSGKARKAVSA